MVVTAPGGMNRTIRDSARRQAARLSAAQIVAEIGGMVGSRRPNVGVTYQETLIDILVHSQDISWPPGRELSVPPQAAAVAMARVWNSGWPFRAKKRLRGLQLSGTDSAWSAGDGPEIRGTSGALLLLLTGRQAALPLLADLPRPSKKPTAHSPGLPDGFIAGSTLYPTKVARSSLSVSRFSPIDLFPAIGSCGRYA
jgi:hypothetical protein